MNQVAIDLRNARKLIERPECWARGFYARDADGRKTSSLSETATRWCAYGAVERVLGPGPAFNVEHRAINALERALPNEFRGIGDFNDAPATTHADILALFDRAIAAAEERAE